jgi:hypothetical protein
VFDEGEYLRELRYRLTQASDDHPIMSTISEVIGPHEVAEANVFLILRKWIPLLIEHRGISIIARVKFAGYNQQKLFRFVRTR